MRMEWRLPLERVVFLEFHAKQRKIKTCKVVVVDTSVKESGGYAKLSYVVLNRKLAGPIRKTWPGRIIHRMVGHAAIDVVLYTVSLSSICQGFAQAHLVSGGKGIDKGILTIFKERVD